MCFVAERQKLDFFVSVNCCFQTFWKCTADAKTNTVSLSMSPKGILLLYTMCIVQALYFNNIVKKTVHNFYFYCNLITWFEYSGNFTISFVVDPFIYLQLPGCRITRKIDTSHFRIQIFLSIFCIICT